MFLPIAVTAQNATLKGTVKDALGNALQGVSVKVKGSSSGTSTDANGVFSLPGTSPSSSLEFSSVGFKTQTVPVKNAADVTVILQESPSQLADVVVVGYGTQKKSNLTGAVASIGNKDFFVVVITLTMKR